LQQCIFCSKRCNNWGVSLCQTTICDVIEFCKSTSGNTKHGPCESMTAMLSDQSITEQCDTRGLNGSPKKEAAAVENFMNNMSSSTQWWAIQVAFTIEMSAVVVTQSKPGCSKKTQESVLPLFKSDTMAGWQQRSSGRTMRACMAKLKQ